MHMQSPFIGWQGKKLIESRDLTQNYERER